VNCGEIVLLNGLNCAYFNWFSWVCSMWRVCDSVDWKHFERCVYH